MMNDFLKGIETIPVYGWGIVFGFMFLFVGGISLWESRRKRREAEVAPVDDRDTLLP